MRINRLISASFVVCYLCLSLSNSVLHAQTEENPAASQLTSSIRFTHLTSDDGLAQNTVEAILQDSQGFMWFGTGDGLSRYDGYRFITYRNDPDNPNSLGQNHIRDLFEDRDGIIWIGTEGGGVNSFNPRTETFTRYSYDPKSPDTLSGDRVFHIFQDGKNNFWFVGGGLTGLNRYNPITKTVARYVSNPNNPNSFKGGAVWDMFEDSTGNEWLAAGTVISKYDPNSDQFSYFQPPLKDGKKEEQLKVFERDSKGNVWVGGNNGLYQFDLQTGTYTPYPELKGISGITKDNVGNFWVASSNTLKLFNPQTKTIIENYQHDAYHEDSLSSARKISLYIDRAGVIWTGTDGSGIDFFDPRQALFTYYRHNPDIPSSLAAGTVNSFFIADNNHLWIGIGSVLELLDLQSTQITHYPLEASIKDFSGSISAVYEDRSGVVWVGVSGFRLYRFDVTSGQFTAFPFKSQNKRPSPPKIFADFYEDDQNNLWIAVSQDGLYQLDSSRSNVQFYEHPSGYTPPDAPPPPANAPHPPINDLYTDHAGYIWLSTLNGFSRFDPRSHTFEAYRANSNSQGADSWIETILEDTDGILWAASRDGLIRFDPVTKTAKYYTQKDGLPTNFIVGIVQDKQGNLWLSTKKGLSKFTPSTGKFRNYDVSDGLQGNEFEEDAFIQTADGRIFFGGSNGLTVFHPDQIADSTYQPPVILTDFQLFNKTVVPGKESLLKQSIWSTSDLTLNHDQNIISFEFAALNYSASKKTHYRYQLDGFENGWNETDSTRRFVTYTNLPAGNYVLRVQATDSNGQWSHNAVSLALTMLPPWWETTWFRILVALLAAGAVLGGYQWRVRAIAQRNRYLEIEVAKKTLALQTQTQELQTRGEQLSHAKEAAESANRAKSAFLASMSHELRSPLNVILGFTQVVHRDNKLASDVRENLGIVLRSGEHLLALINQVLDLSKIEAGHMTLNEVDFDLYRLLDDLEEMFILNAEEKRLQLLFEYSSDLPRYIHTDAVKLRQILINLISNALKFTKTGGVTLRVRQINKTNADLHQLEFEVEDTGAGIAADEIDALFEAFAQAASGRQNQEGTGLGLAISRRFIRLMGGDISVKSVLGHGSTFTFQIQYKEATSAETSTYGNQRRIVALEPNQPQYRMLVVDDKWVNRQLLIKLLTPLGFEVREAENGQEAIEILRVFQPHLVWMDMRMPVMNGVDATKHIKATPQGQTTIVVALTASAFDEEREDIIAGGCDDFLRKPFRTEDIFEMISKHLGVRYIYAENEPDKSVKPGKDKLQTSELKSAIHTLPAELVAQLVEGIELGDSKLIDEVITEIDRYDHTLAEALGQLANRFEYDKLLDLARETLDEPT